MDYDKGKNDGYDQQVLGPDPNTENCPNGNWTNEPRCFLINPSMKDNIQPYTYVIQSQIQPYWDMAKQYVLGDNTFASNNGPTFVSHQYLIAGQAAHSAEVPTFYYKGMGLRYKPKTAYERYLDFGSADPPVYGPKVGHEYRTSSVFPPGDDRSVSDV